MNTPARFRCSPRADSLWQNRCRRAVAWSALLVFASPTITGCGETEATAERDVRPTVRVTKPLQRKVTEYAYFTGRTDAIESVDLKSRVTGYLDTVDFVSGSEVKTGQQLFLIDPRPYKATLDAAQAQVKLTEAQLALAKANLARAQEIAKTPGAISQREIDTAAAQEGEAAASVAAAKADAESAQLNFDFTKIISPIDGQIGRNYPTIGNLITQDNTLLATIVTQDPIYGYFDVDERALLRVNQLIREGKIRSKQDGAIIPVEMGLSDESNDYPHEGTVDFINNRISPTTGTLEVRGVFKNPRLGEGKARLLVPGMFVRIRVPIGDPFEALLVPQAAIGTDQSRKYLLVVNDKDVVEYRTIEPGPEQPDAMQVVFPVQMHETPDGLQPLDSAVPSTASNKIVDSIGAGDRIIVGGLQNVRPGTAVNVKDVTMTAVIEQDDSSVGLPSTDR